MRRLPNGANPQPEVSTNRFPAVGGDMSGVIADLSFVQVPGMQMMARSGPVCETCMKPEADHSEPGTFSPLAAVPGVHPLTDTARNSADYVSPSRNQTFFGSVRPTGR